MPEELLSTQVAAEMIDGAIREPGGIVYWTRYLTNNRRDDRNPPHRVPFQRISNGAFYRPADIAEFIEFEKSRRIGVRKLSGRAAEAMRAYGIGEAGGSTTGRKLDCAILPQTDPATGAPYVSMTVDNPLLVFRLDLDQARQIRDELAEVIKVCERAAA